MRKQPQLYLTVVGIDKDISLRCNEHLADMAAELLAYGYVLKIRVGARQSAGRGDGHLELGSYPAVRIDELQKPVGICALELCEHAVIENHVNYRVLAAQLFKNVGICAPAGFRFFAGREHELIEKHLAELLGRIDVKLAPGVLVYGALQLRYRAGQPFAKANESRLIYHKALLLHIGQNAAQRHFYLVEELCHAELFKLFLGHRAQSVHSLRSVKLCAAIAYAHAAEAVVSGSCVKQISCKRRIIYKAVKRQLFGNELRHQIFDIVRSLLDFIRKHKAQQL